MQKGLFCLLPGSLGLPLTPFKEVKKEKMVSYSHQPYIAVTGWMQLFLVHLRQNIVPDEF